MVIIETMRTDPREPRWSPIELSRTLSVSLNTLSYHVTYLRDAGVITVTPSVVQSML
ncbi:MAG: helix-turn-helix domain-containing protein [Solirubrobacterales bacterium]